MYSDNANGGTESINTLAKDSVIKLQNVIADCEVTCINGQTKKKE